MKGGEVAQLKTQTQVMKLFQQLKDGGGDGRDGIVPKWDEAAAAMMMRRTQGCECNYSQTGAVKVMPSQKQYQNSELN